MMVRGRRRHAGRPGRARTLAALLYAALAMAWSAPAQNVVEIDARQPAPAVEPVPTLLGSARAPDGQTLGVNSRYLTRNGKPWIPVMGEFHYSRVPEPEWNDEILKMKSAGVNVISTYVIWIHHEQVQGQWNWTGQRDLRRFVRLCAAHGMYVYPRIGPWAHAETRNGGLPDWVLKAGPVRQNDPVYLKEVDAFYAQIAEQLQGLLWKDGGPVIGLQLENEYRARGPGRGDEHLRTLKAMALAHGLDVPLYTVTGWDNAAIPLETALPVFGGYPAAPWEGISGKLPPAEVYAFRFDNRSAGSMGAVGGGGQGKAEAYRGTPFLTAEVGGGIEDTYWRRPVLSADDIAALGPVMLGSGANLLGYYMFHGGRNPDGGAITLEESQRTGYPTDVPVKSYDFQAPIGEFGLERASLRKMKLLDYFLNDFGSLLAPMTVRQPSVLPTAPGDLGVARVAVRSDGERGFIFFNNYLRGATMPARPGFQVHLRLPAGGVSIPAQPVTLPPGAYGVWPVNLALGAATTLRYSTAQLVARGTRGGSPYLVFFSLPGIVPEWRLSGPVSAQVVHGRLEVQKTGADLLLRGDANDEAEAVLPDGTHLLLLPEAVAEQVWRGSDPGLLVRTAADVFVDGPRWTFDQLENTQFHLGIFGDETVTGAQNTLRRGAGDGIFAETDAAVAAVKLPLRVTPEKTAGVRPSVTLGPAVSWRPNRIPMAPEDADFQAAASWRIAVPSLPDTPSLHDVFLRVSYEGDVARLTEKGALLEDNFWNGTPWTVSLRGLNGSAGSAWRAGAAPLELRVLPLPQTLGAYFDEVARPHAVGGQTLALHSVTLVPQYRIQVQIEPKVR